jgi:hypothetical protein
MTSPTDLPGTPELPGPVDLERLQSVVSTLGWTMVAVGERTLRGRWDDVQVDLTIPESEGVVVLLRGSRLAAVPAAQRAGVEEFVLQWHRQRVWPSLFVGDDGAGDVALGAHVGLDATEGLTTPQLLDGVRVGVGTIQQAFAELGRVLEGSGQGGAADDSGPDDDGPSDPA